MAALTAPFLTLNAVSADASSRNRNRNRNRLQNSSSGFYIPKPSWVVKTESNVWKEERRKPHPPCVICLGSGRVDCKHCEGRGRMNCLHLSVLPKGEWPKWCKTCGGSGLGYCPRCLGTGEYRDIMGFHFMKIETKPAQNHHENQIFK